MVVLYWLKGNGTYKQFVQNRIDYINSKAQTQWHYVSTDENPADIGSRECKSDKLPKKWLEGPTWLQNKEEWPKQNDIEPKKESEEEAKLLKEVFYTVKLDESQVDVLINKFELWKTIRILSWTNRFLRNTKSKERTVKTDQINNSIEMLIKQEQSILERTKPILPQKSTSVRVEFKVTTQFIFQEIAS